MNATATRVNCAEATLRSIVDLGGEVLFSIPGRGIYPLLEELPKVPGLRYVTGLHEFPLAAVADGWARASGKVPFLNLYMSTGTLNAASSIFLSQRDRVPMVVTATQAESWAVGADHRAEIEDIVAAMRPVTKWAWMPPTPDRVPEALRRAHAIATTPPCGPTFVAIPVDYWGAEVEYAPPAETVRLSPPPAADSPELGRIADLFAAAELPCLVVGRDAIVEGGSEALLALAERRGIPVVAEPEPPTLPAPSRHPLFAGSVAEAVDLFARVDLVAHVGVNTYEAFHGEILAAGAPKRHVWIGSSDRELNKVVEVELAAMLPAGPAARALAGAVEARLEADPGASARAAERRAEVERLIAEERAPILAKAEAVRGEVPMSIAEVVSILRAHLPEETLLLDHSTTAVRLVREFFPVPRGELYLSASGSCQGWGLPAAVGAQLADPARPTVGIVGDGGFMFGVQAIWTAQVAGAPLLAVVLNNGGWSSMRASLAARSPAVIEAGLEMNFGWEVEFADLARSLGVDGVTVRTPEELEAALAERLPLSAPLVLDARCRREPKTSASPYVGY
ncbi:MAG: thiamine pyrophosphate-binding protein [Actinobacteria bacterium]|nr:thiamine pyrophosphate-binding protein [Actinomycetota bacterium]